MKFLSTKNELKTNLTLIGSIIPGKPTHPILSHVLVVADEKLSTVSMTAFDLNIGVMATFGAEVIEGGSATIPYKLFNDTIGRFQDGEITIESKEMDSSTEEEKAEQIIVSSEAFNLSLRTLMAESYPPLPKLEESEPIKIFVGSFVEALKNVTFAASNDEIKQQLSGVHLKGSSLGMKFAATDGHRLAVVDTFFSDQGDDDLALKESIPFDFEMIIPAKGLKELYKVLARHQNNEQLEIYTDQKVVIFEVGNHRLTSRLIDGNYPTYEKMIPEEFATTVTLDRKRLIKGLDLVSVLYNQKNNLVKFNFDAAEQTLLISVDSKELGSVKDSWAIEISGDSTEVAFNGKYLIEGLKLFSGQDIQVQLNQGLKPVVFSPIGNSKVIYLVMPLQIRD